MIRRCPAEECSERDIETLASKKASSRLDSSARFILWRWDSLGFGKVQDDNRISEFPQLHGGGENTVWQLFVRAFCLYQLLCTFLSVWCSTSRMRMRQGKLWGFSKVALFVTFLTDQNPAALRWCAGPHADSSQEHARGAQNGKVSDSLLVRGPLEQGSSICGPTIHAFWSVVGTTIPFRDSNRYSF